MYGSPGSDYFYHSLSVGLSTEFHPLAPFERVDAGVYELGVVFRSVDDVKLGEIHDIDVVLDYPDVVETFNDVVIPAGGKRLKLKSRFRELKAVSLTLQDTQAPGVPQTAIVSGKDRHGFTVSCFDLSGTPVEGMVDATCVGF
jgi:hypothetical protein